MRRVAEPVVGVDLEPVLSPRLTREAFREKFLRASGITEAEFKALGFRIEPCRCGYSFCEGWEALTDFMTVRRNEV